MKMSEKRRFAKKTPKQLARKRRKKSKQDQIRQERETAMVVYLLDKGWSRKGPDGEVWTADHWKPQNHMGGYDRRYMMSAEQYPDVIHAVYHVRPPKNWQSDKASMTLTQAYNNQMRLDAMGFERAKSIDDDLADLL